LAWQAVLGKWSLSKEQALPPVLAGPGRTPTPEVQAPVDLLQVQVPVLLTTAMPNGPTRTPSGQSGQ